MFGIEFSRMFSDFECKHSILVSSLVVLIWLPRAPPVEGMSVPSLCMREQRRILNLTEDVKLKQEDRIIDTIQTICRDYIGYITCFTNNLPNSNELGDRFSRLMFQPRSMFMAYKGLCTGDMEALRKIKACLVVTPELTTCYKKYEKGVKKVVELLDQGTFTTGDLERLACNVSVGRYKCEIEAYTDCNSKAGEIMTNFIYASLSDNCRHRMGLTSRYTQEMKLIWQNEFERLMYEDQHREFLAYYDESLVKTSISRLEFYTLASRFASILRGSGLDRGDVVLCALPLCPEAAVVNYGAIFAGAAVVHSSFSPDNPVLFPHCVKQSTAKFIVMRSISSDPTWQEVKDHVGQLMPGFLHTTFSDPKMPNVKRAILVNRGGDDDFLSYVRSHGGCYVDRDVSEDSLAAMYLTSGTTGVPKLVMRAHKSLVLDARAGVFPSHVSPKGNTRRFFHNAPWSWAVASSFDLLDGYTRVHPDQWHPVKDSIRMTVDILKKDGVRYMFLTPPELKGILAIWDEPSKKVAACMLVAGFPVTREMCQWMLTASEKICVRFGCSEMISISYNLISCVEDFEDFDTGLIYDGTVAMTVNDKMEELPRGTPGRILLKSNSMFIGYMGQPEKTSEALDDKGWYVTTDAGYIDDKQHLFIIGRYDYVIKHKGHQYYPSTIEKEIRGHPEVKDVLVVPIPNEQNHHNICAYVVRDAGSENDVINAVTEAAKKGDNSGKIAPPQHIIFSDCIERNDRGKINRNKMIENAIELTRT